MRVRRCLAASGVATGIALTGGAGPAAADDGPTGPQPRTPLACDTADGVTVTDYLIDFSAPGRLRSGGATITDIDVACAGLTIRVSVGDRDGTALAQGRATVPAEGGTVDVAWDPEAGARSVPIADIEVVTVALVKSGGADEPGGPESGDAGADPSPDGLPWTGTDALPLAVLGAGMVGLGAAVVTCARRARRGNDEG